MSRYCRPVNGEWNPRNLQVGRGVQEGVLALVWPGGADHVSSRYEYSSVAARSVLDWKGGGCISKQQDTRQDDRSRGRIPSAVSVLYAASTRGQAPLVPCLMLHAS